MSTQKSNRLSGRVTDAQGRPLARLLIQAFDRDMRAEEPLGEAITDREGKYQIEWKQSQLDGRGRKTADIGLTIRTPEQKTLLFKSGMDDIRFNAGQREGINIVLRQPLPQEVVEFDFLLKEIKFLAGHVAPKDLQEDTEHRDITFLSKEIGVDYQKIEHFAVAHKLEAASEIHAAFFYALLRKNTLLKNDWANSVQVRLSIGLATDIQPLLFDAALTDPKIIERDVQAAAEALIISKEEAAEVKRHLAQLEKYRQAANEYFLNEHPKKVLETVSVFALEDKLGEIGRIFEENKYDLDAFFQKVNDPAFFQTNGSQHDPEAIALLGEMLGFDSKVIESVKKSKKIKQPGDIRRLAAMDKSGWKSELSKVADGEILDKKLVDFQASVLVRKMEVAFPTVAFAAQLGREKGTVLQNQSDIVQFLEAHDDFDLRHTNIDLFVKNKQPDGAAKKSAAAPPISDSLREELKSVQRVFKLVPNYRKTMGLRAQKIHSAQGLAAVGERQFVQRVAPQAGIPKTEARQVFRRAQQISAAAQLIAGELQSAVRAGEVAALSGGNDAMALKLTKVAADFPNMKSLFQIGENCACDHCRSVYSPAAYLVEALQFLENRKTSGGSTAKRELFQRLPHIGDIDLGCENAETPLPYIDLVCELLEAEIAPDAGIPFSGNLSTLPDPKMGKISNPLAVTLRNAGLPVTSEALIFGTEKQGALPVAPFYLRDKKAVCRIEEVSPGNYLVFRLRQTLSTADELAAAPEYVNAQAYQILQNERFAFRLPFDLNHTEAKAYFERFGVSRADLMRDFQVANVPLSRAVAAERLGLTDVERDWIVVPRPTPNGQQRVWNVPGGSANLLSFMKQLDQFLSKTGLSFQQADLLLSLKFIDPLANLFIRNEAGLSSCDTAQKSIPNLNRGALDRIHRFLRLQKRTGWRFETLNEIIRQPRLGNGVLNNACIVHAADLSEIAQKTGISLDELVGFYQQIPFQEYRSAEKKPLYHHVFLNKAKNGILDERLLPEKINGSKLLATVEENVAVCLQISLQDLRKLSATLPLNPVLDFSNLSFLFAASRLMKKLKLTADEFVGLRQLSGIDFQASPAKTLEFIAAAEAAKMLPMKLVDLRFMLHHEAPNRTDREIKDEKIEAILKKWQADFQKAFDSTKSVFDENLSAEVQKEVLQGQLSKFESLSKDDSDIIIGLVDANWTFDWVNSPGTTVSSTNRVSAGVFLHFILDNLFTVSAVTAIENLLEALDVMFPTSPADNAVLKQTAYDAALLVVQNTVDAIANAPDAATKALAEAQLLLDQAAVDTALVNLNIANSLLEKSRRDLLGAFFAQIAEIHFIVAKTAALEQAISTHFKADLDQVKVILNAARLKKSTIATGIFIKDVLLDEDLIDKTAVPPVLPTVTTLANYPKMGESLRLLHKLLPFVAAFKLGNTALGWHFQHNPALAWFLWDEIPFDHLQADANFQSFLAFAKMLARAHSLAPVVNPADADSPVSFYSVADLLVSGTATQDEFLEKWALLLGFEKSDVLAVDAHHFPAWNLANYNEVKNWEKLESCLAHLQKLGSSVGDAVAFCQPVLTQPVSSKLRALLKSRYDEDTWLSTLKEIMDAIRPQKRNALVAYLLAENSDFRDENDLYDYFLVDVEMESCMMSSRIVLAHNTVQLFAQRCLMGLEPAVVADAEADPDWAQWHWMKNYRVWEANRNIWLYPENLLEPELRDDKSFLFSELENEIQQNELTDLTAENALINYLEKLDNIAFLEVVATWYEVPKRVMHVFARTKGGDPAIYFYRKFEEERYWTAWEKVELDITSDHLLAFVRNGRLTLAWAVVSEEPSPNQTSTVPSEGQSNFELDKPKRKLKIQLAMSEFANKKWQPKKVSRDAILTPGDYTTNEQLLRRDIYNLMYLEATEQVLLVSTTFDAYDYGNGSWGQNETQMVKGAFNLTGCKGYPELAQKSGFLVAGDFNANLDYSVNTIIDFLPDFKDAGLRSQRYREQGKIQSDDLSVKNGVSFFDFIELLRLTPGTFRLSYPHQFTMADWVSNLYQLLVFRASNPGKDNVGHGRFSKISLGTLLPYFMEDSRHNYVVIPGFYQRQKQFGLSDAEKMTASGGLQFIEDAFTLYERLNTGYYTEIKELLDDPLFIELAQKVEQLQRSGYGEQFKNFYHPLVCPLRTVLYRDGIPGLMKRQVQMQRTAFDFQNHYQPSGYVPVSSPHLYPIEDVDFSSDGSYSQYNWELFFHVPFMIATRLTKNQRFEEAMKWFHYIFDPTGALTWTPDGTNSATSPQKYWVTKPFFEHQASDYLAQRIDQILYRIADPTSPDLADLEFAIRQWREKPFRPHVVARFRTVAHEKAVVVKYVENFMAWGDHLFRQATMESVVQATQMYILADKLLGEKPQTVPPLVKPPYETYNQIEARLDDFGNALIDLENILPDFSALPEGGAELPSPMPTTSLNVLYFCVPKNEKMLEIWDRVADRLFKIRHCRDIDGNPLSLSLFAPPIDPGALARAAAGGLSVSDVLAGLNAPTPYYRFNVLSQKATELTNEVRSLGSSLLQVLEKKDDQAMALLRSELEIKVLNAVREVKKLQIRESKEQIEVLKRTKKVTEERFNFYKNIEKIISKEQLNLDKLGEAKDWQLAANIVYTLGGVLALIPDIMLGVSGFGGTPHGNAKFGGSLLAHSTDAIGKGLGIFSAIASYEASRASILGGYDRRFTDWKLQERLANLELKSIDKQILAAEIRREIAETDLKNHDLQIENAKKTDEFMRSKYTNLELYNWMQGQISAVYFQAYQLAHDFAKKAERCYRFELGNDDTFISYGYWDSLKKGLQSADQLLHDLKRMETNYLDKNRREYEITKHISLALLDPLALVQLRATGSCDFEVPEALFDLDFAGQYFRRVKSVSLSLPCVAGPYTSVSAKLSLVKNKYRKDTSDAANYPETPIGGDPRFVYNLGAIQSIAASNAQNDSGVFELNFRDERYLPFENTGAISTWRLELPKKDLAQFDYDNISDVVLHMKYTSREGGSGLRSSAETILRNDLNLLRASLNETGLRLMFNLKHDFPNEWHLLKQTGSAKLKIDQSRLPYFAQMLNATIGSVMFIATSPTNPAVVSIDNLTDPVHNISFNPITGWGEMWQGQQVTNKIEQGEFFELSNSSADLTELMLVVKYAF